MMIHSDNMATDLVIRTVGTQATNRFLDQQGCKNTRVSLELGRWHYVILGMTKLPVSRANDQVLVSRIKAGQFDNDGLGYSDSLQNNVCGPRDMGLLLERLYLGQVANQSDTVEMLKLMRASTRHFPFGLSLEPAKLELVKAVYEDGAAIKDVAGQIGRSPTGLYKALARIRNRLATCVQTKLGAAAEGLT